MGLEALERRVGTHFSAAELARIAASAASIGGNEAILVVKWSSLYDPSVVRAVQEHLIGFSSTGRQLSQHVYYFKSLCAIYKWRNQLAEDVPDAISPPGHANQDKYIGKVWVVTGNQRFLYAKSFFTSTPTMRP